MGVPLRDFLALARIPILIVYGDNIPDSPSANSGADGWRARLAMAQLWRDAVNAKGGNVTVVHLLEIGIRGNTHFPFPDVNNEQIADVVSGFLKTSSSQLTDTAFLPKIDPNGNAIGASLVVRF